MIVQNRSLRSVLVKLFIAAAVSACVENSFETRNYPVVDTTPSAEVSESGAVLQGKVLNTGISGVVDHGFVYSTQADPRLDNGEVITLGALPTAGTFSAVANRSLIKGTTYHARAYAVSKEKKEVYGQEIEFVSLGSLPPVIKEIEPVVAAVEDTIKIIGSGFSNIKNLNVVYFESAYSTVVKSHSDTIWCKVPEAVISPSDIAVTVGQHTVKAPVKFQLTKLEFTGFAPDTVSFEDTLSLYGNNFALSKEYNRVEILGQPALVIHASKTSLKAVVGNRLEVTSGSVKVTLGSQSASLTKKVFLRKPMITGITPLSGGKDAEITISGDHFSPYPSDNKVTFNAIDLPVVRATRKSLVVKLPALLPAQHPFVVTVVGRSATSPQQFRAKGPLINSIEPNEATWNDVIAIRGKGFAIHANENNVKFGSVAAEVVSATEDELKVKVPPGLLVKYSQITVQSSTLAGYTALFPTPFALSATTITSFHPGEGKANEIITVTGTNFNPIAENQLVKFGDYQATVIESTGTSLKVKLPPTVEDKDVPLGVTIAGQVLSHPTAFHLISPWKRLKDFPNEISNATAFTIQGQGYAIGGMYGNNIIWKYQHTTDTWNGLIQSGIWGYNLISFVIDDEAYFGLPSDENGKNTANYFKKFDPQTNTWTDLKSSNAPLITRATGFSIAGKGYIVGGIFPFPIPPYGTAYMPTAATYLYDPATNTWTQKDFLPLEWLQGFADASGFLVNDHFYISGRIHNTTASVFGEYDHINDAWTKHINEPPEREGASSFSIDGIGYRVGGSSTARGAEKDFWMYNASTQSWVQLADFPGKARTEAFVFVVGNKAYYGTGSETTGNLKDMWEFDPSKL